MSSDDEEVILTETGPVSRYKVSIKPWRSLPFGHTMRTIDLAGAKIIVRDLRGGKRGERVVDPTKLSTRPAPQGKFSNLYDAAWYKKLDELDKRALKVQAKRDLKIPDWATKYVLSSVHGMIHYRLTRVAFVLQDLEGGEDKHEPKVVGRSSLISSDSTCCIYSNDVLLERLNSIAPK